jgi:hypothetical protein
VTAASDSDQSGSARPVGAQMMDMPPQYAQPRVQRVNVNFSEQAYQTLQDLATQSGKSMSEVLREAIALKAWFDRERAEGNRILTEGRDGRIREVISV